MTMGRKRSKRSAIDTRKEEERREARTAVLTACRKLDDVSAMLRTGVFSRNWWVAGGVALITLMLAGIYGVAAVLLTFADK